MLKVDISLLDFKLMVQIGLNAFKNLSVWRAYLNLLLLRESYQDLVLDLFAGESDVVWSFFEVGCYNIESVLGQLKHCDLSAGVSNQK